VFTVWGWGTVNSPSELERGSIGAFYMWSRAEWLASNADTESASGHANVRALSEPRQEATRKVAS
jgi:hypothetical protein